MDALVALLPKIFCLVNRHWYGNTTRVSDTYVVLIEYNCGYTHSSRIKVKRREIERLVGPPLCLMMLKMNPCCQKIRKINVRIQNVKVS